MATILLVEDDTSMRLLTTAKLKHRYAIISVQDGVEALDVLERQPVDLTIADVMMPRMDGYTLVKTLRERGDQIPVLLLTAKQSFEDKREGFSSGVDDYMTKPFMMSEFLARVRALTRRRSTIGPQVLTYGDLSLDSATYELICGEKRSRLTAKEYQIMELLMENAGRLISTEQIMDRIWGFESASEINVVWVNISYLRRKLKELGSRVVISSHRGIGYTLRDSEPEE